MPALTPIKTSLSTLVLGAIICVLGVFTPGCSFIFDFDECDSLADCRGFDQPSEGKYFACSNDNKCVLEAERECRQTKHCTQSTGTPLVCEEASGRCVPAE